MVEDIRVAYTLLIEALDDSGVHHLVLVHLSDLGTNHIHGKPTHWRGFRSAPCVLKDSNIPASLSIVSSSVKTLREVGRTSFFTEREEANDLAELYRLPDLIRIECTYLEATVAALRGLEAARVAILNMVIAGKR
jgi:hypothetical protein